MVGLRRFLRFLSKWNHRLQGWLHLDKLFEPVIVFENIYKICNRKRICVYPMLRIFPALRHHRLRGKIHNIFRLKLLENLAEIFQVGIYIQSLKLKVFWCFLLPLIWRKNFSCSSDRLTPNTSYPLLSNILQKCDPEKEFDPITMNLFIACVLDCDANLKPNSRYGSLEFLLDPSHDHMTDN